MIESGEVTLGVVGDHSVDLIRSLRGWLLDDDDLQCRVVFARVVPESNTLGPSMDALVVALAPGVATALASVLIAWIRRQTGDGTIRITRIDGTSVELDIKNVQRAP